MSVRWDAVVKRAAVDVRPTPTPPPPPPSAIKHSAECVEVHVRLFGALAALSAERSIRLELPTTATIAHVLGALRGRLGEEFLAHVLDAAGAKRRHCRLFVDGYPIEDLQTVLQATADPSEIDIILLIAPEGG